MTLNLSVKNSDQVQSLSILPERDINFPILNGTTHHKFLHFWKKSQSFEFDI